MDAIYREGGFPLERKTDGGSEGGSGPYAGYGAIIPPPSNQFHPHNSPKWLIPATLHNWFHLSHFPIDNQRIRPHIRPMGDPPSQGATPHTF
jgi:hypothetical protein